MMHRYRLPAVMLTTVAITAGLVACSSDNDADDAEDPLFGYAMPAPIVTLNAASSLGAVTDAAKVSARLYPGAFLTGPDGRLLPNTDLVAASRSHDDPDIINYRISDSATYSDGAPVVCDDFMLSWAAAQNPQHFSASLSVAERVSNVNCETGQRSFSVEFDDGMGSRFRELFSVGEVLPSHTVGERAGVEDVVAAVNAGDPGQLAALGDAWSTTFTVTENDPSLVPTYGPFRVAARGDDGSLTLAVNPEWSGVRPGLDEIVLWSAAGAGLEGPDYAALTEEYRLYVADLPPEVDPVAAGLDVVESTETSETSESSETSATTGETTGETEPETTAADQTDETVRPGADSSAPDLTDADDISGRFAVTRDSGTRIDGLTLSDTGVFESRDDRQAFARCVDRAAVAGAVEDETGITVEEAPFRIVSPGSTAGESLGDIAARNNNTDTGPTSDRLGGQTVRVGYFEDVARYRAIVDTLVESCGQAGVTVEPVPLSVGDFGQLGTDYDVLLETSSSFGRNPEVMLPTSAGASGTATVRQLRDAENVLADATSTVPLTAEPRSVAVDRGLSNVVDNPGETGMSWNMDRWVSPDFPTDTTEPTETSSEDTE